MVFLFSVTTSLFATYTFVKCWKAMPVSWLFDCSDLSAEERKLPHPHSHSLSSPIPQILLFLLFLTVTLDLWKKVALRDVFGGLSLFWFLIQIALSDYDYRLIPDQWSLGIAILGFLRLIFTPMATAPFPALFLCIILSLSLHILPRIFTGTPALGMGDVKLIFALAIVLTLQEFIAVMTSAALLGGAAAIIMILLHNTKHGVPYGTVIAGGALISLFL